MLTQAAELADHGVASLHSLGGKSLLRWHAYRLRQPRCASRKYHHHPTGGTCIVSVSTGRVRLIRHCQPELLAGSLRENLDPFSQHDDATLNEALRSAGLFSLQEGTDEGRLTLDSVISSSGGNLSVGQRQIIALARAIVRRSRLLILDEATSAIGASFDIERVPVVCQLFIFAIRLRHGRHHPGVAEERGCEGRHTSHDCTPVADHHGFG